MPTDERERWISDVDRWLARLVDRAGGRRLRPGLYLSEDVIEYLERHPTARVHSSGAVLTRPGNPSLLLSASRSEANMSNEQIRERLRALADEIHQSNPQATSILFALAGAIGNPTTWTVSGRW